jgi:hypothetical protein
MSQIPTPSKMDVFDILLAVAAWHENLSNQYQDGEMSKETYDHECSKQFQRLLSYANCVTSVNEQSLIEFWTRHKNFAEWGLVNPRTDAYSFLSPKAT